MAVKLNRTAYAHAKKLIRERHAVLDARDAWSEHRPSAQQENAYLSEHGENEYRKWFLAIDDEHREGTKARYKFPYGDFRDVHRCGVISAESRAGQNKYLDVENAAAHLHGMLDALA
jgi:tRNA splicing ligase